MQRLNNILKKVTIHDEVTEDEIAKIFHISADQYIDGIIKESLKESSEYLRVYGYELTSSKIREQYLEHIAHYERKEFEWKKLSPEFIAEVWKIIKENTDKEKEKINFKEKKDIDKVRMNFEEKIESFCLYFDNLVELEKDSR